MTRKCHPFTSLRAGSEAKPKDLDNAKEILRFAQNDSKAVSFKFLASHSYIILCVSAFLRSGVSRRGAFCRPGRPARGNSRWAGLHR